MRLSFIVSLSIRLQTSIWEPHLPNGRHEDVKRAFHLPKDDPPLLAWGAGCTTGDAPDSSEHLASLVDKIV
jgi:hypothetical protein